MWSSCHSVAHIRPMRQNTLVRSPCCLVVIVTRNFSRPSTLRSRKNQFNFTRSSYMSFNPLRFLISLPPNFASCSIPSGNDRTVQFALHIVLGSRTLRPSSCTQLLTYLFILAFRVISYVSGSVLLLTCFRCRFAMNSQFSTPSDMDRECNEHQTPHSNSNVSTPSQIDLQCEEVHDQESNSDVSTPPHIGCECDVLHAHQALESAMCPACREVCHLCLAKNTIESLEAENRRLVQQNSGLQEEIRGLRHFNSILQKDRVSLVEQHRKLREAKTKLKVENVYFRRKLKESGHDDDEHQQ